MVHMEKLLSPRELAEYVGVPLSTVYQWNYARSGPPPIRVGKHIRFRECDIETWLRDREKAL